MVDIARNVLAALAVDGQLVFELEKILSAAALQLFIRDDGSPILRDDFVLFDRACRKQPKTVRPALHANMVVQLALHRGRGLGSRTDSLSFFHLKPRKWTGTRANTVNTTWILE